MDRAGVLDVVDGGPDDATGIVETAEYLDPAAGSLHERSTSSAASTAGSRPPA